MKLQITWIIFNAQLKRTEQHWLCGADFSCLPLLAAQFEQNSSCDKKRQQKLVLLVAGFLIYFTKGLDEEAINIPNPRHETLRPDFPRFLEKKEIKKLVNRFYSAFFITLFSLKSE